MSAWDCKRSAAHFELCCIGSTREEVPLKMKGMASHVDDVVKSTVTTASLEDDNHPESLDGVPSW